MSKPCICYIDDEQPNHVFNIHEISNNDLSKLDELIKANKDKFSDEFVKHISFIYGLEYETWVMSPDNPMFD